MVTFHCHVSDSQKVTVEGKGRDGKHLTRKRALVSVRRRGGGCVVGGAGVLAEMGLGRR